VPKKTKPAETEESALPEASGGESKVDKVKKSRPSKPPRKKTAGSKTPSSPQRQRTAEPSDEQIRTRAYFISERRHRLGLPGDASSDWLDAKRQLLSELGPR